MKKIFLTVLFLMISSICFAFDNGDGGGGGTASDIAYDASSWDGNTDAPTKNAVRDKIETVTAGATGVDETYGSGWNADASAPEKDDVYDYLHYFDADDDHSFTDETWFTNALAAYLASAGTDNIKDTHIDWGSGAGQVDLADIPGGTAPASAFDFNAATLRLPTGNADPTATAGYFRHDSTITNFTNGGLVYYNGAVIKQIVDMTTATASACTDDYVVAYDADNDLWYCKADANSGGTPTVITVADTTDTTAYVAFFESATGDLGPKTDAGATYNASTGLLTTSIFSSGAGGFSVDADGDTTAKSITLAASTSPTDLYSDSDAPGTDKEIAKIVGAYVDGADGAENGTLDLYAHVAGTTTSYIQLDGKNTQVEIVPKLIASSTLDLSGTTDATIARSKAGQISVEGVDVPTISSTDTFTNKTYSTAGTGNDFTAPLNGVFDQAITDPADADDLIYAKSMNAATITDIYCIAEGGGTITLTLQECDSAGANCGNIEGAITCDSDGAEDDGTLTDGSFAANGWIKALFSAPTGTVNSLAWSVKGTQVW